MAQLGPARKLAGDPFRDHLSRTTTIRPKTSSAYEPMLDNPSGVLFLDIETTGLSRHYDYITLVGYQVAGEYRVWRAGDDPGELLSSIASAGSLVTFNGSNFDLPFLEKAFPDILWPRHHVDLRYACKRVGLTGGQKSIEEQLQISCRQGIEGVDGAMAVILWHRYLRNDHQALRQLIEYNRADVRAMGFILDHVIALNASDDLLSSLIHYRFGLDRDQPIGLAHWATPIPPPPTDLWKPVTFEHLFNDTAAESATVVGLDLTGSAKRPSGVCVMKGPTAKTQTLATDEEIVEAVLSASPDLVSIDSPLCLPVGRTMVTDDDPMRAEAGIMRVSERILKRRGINVYPCLLPSMQRLTERGIRLAQILRSRGIPVIECYPGAAQDIMGIPRKGAGLEWLELGLSDFGVIGPYTEQRVSHDELDAITCSTVGFFHLAGLTEGIGGTGEEPMIIPDLHAGKGLVIGISGPMFAGKTTAARFLEGHGHAYTRISEVIDDVLHGRGEEITRENQQRIGLELHREKGQRWLCARAVERLRNEPAKLVIDGLRWVEDVAYFKERYGGRFRHVHLDAPLNIRRDRAERVGRLAEFEEAKDHAVESGLVELASIAQDQIVNDQDVESLRAALAKRVLFESEADAG